MRRYRISSHRSVKKLIASLAPEMRRRIKQAIAALAEDPRPHGCVKLAGSKNDWRIRIGKYRVLYEIDDDELFVWVFKADLRDEAYSD